MHTSNQSQSVNKGSESRARTVEIGNDYFSCSPHTQLALSRCVQVAGEGFDLSSDLHLPRDEQVVAKVIRTLVRGRTSKTFICAGDLFDAADGGDTSAWASRLLNDLAAYYERVIYTPGNHCLRGRDDPWESFYLAPNVFMPKAQYPLLVKTERNLVLAANCFYDLAFIDPSHLGMGLQEIIDFYRATTDGRSFLKGDISLFKEMSRNLACALTEEVTVLVTHALPNPGPVRFRVKELTAAHLALAERLGACFECDHKDDAHWAQVWRTTPEEARVLWNKKSIVMGSDVLNHTEASPREGLVAMYGHNHAQFIQNVRVRNGASVTLTTHQPFGGRPDAWRASP